MAKNAKWDNLSFSEMVNLHNQSAPKCPSYEEIEATVVELTYSFPQIYFGLNEEDASEFVLFIYPELKGIIQRYNPQRGSFEQYLCSIIKFKLKIFHAEQEHEKFNRKLVEYTQFPEIYNGYVVKETPSVPDSSKLKIINYVFYYSSSARRRFFVFFMSLAPFMSFSEIEEICSLFCYDRKQTYSLIDKLKAYCTDSLEELEKLKMKRNLYFSRYLLSNDKNNLFIRDKKNAEIGLLQKRANYRDLGIVLNLTAGSVGNYLYYSRNLLTWIQDVYEFCSPRELGIQPDLYTNVLAMKYEGKKILLKPFKPIEEFQIRGN